MKEQVNLTAKSILNVYEVEMESHSFLFIPIIKDNGLVYVEVFTKKDLKLVHYIPFDEDNKSKNETFKAACLKQAQEWINQQ